MRLQLVVATPLHVFHISFLPDAETVPTLSRGDDTLADLQRAALFIQRSALQNLKEIGTGNILVMLPCSVALDICTKVSGGA